MLAKSLCEQAHEPYLEGIQQYLPLSFLLVARAVGFEPTTNGFGDHYSTS
tara:strand:- start:57478 stop:57627 length:150 start_codon:yes stop_codon:yes gene_type:complete